MPLHKTSHAIRASSKTTQKKSAHANPVYLDNNATTPLIPAVAAAMAECLRENFGNPSSSHYYGIRARLTVDKARSLVAGLINARPDEIIFTSGGTEANNMAILGTALRYESGHIISSCIEHPSVANPLRHLEDLGFSVTYLPVDKYGMINPDDLRDNLRKDTFLITIMHSNNETGTIQPIAKAGRIAKSRGILFHCDAAQSVGKVPLNLKRLNLDFLTIVSHKFYGPKGVGALYMREGAELKPITYGASHERGLRPGTENVASIHGFGKASEIAKKEMTERVSGTRALTNIFYNELRRGIPGIRLNGHPTKRLPNTLNISFPDVSGSLLLERLEGKIAASTGSACHAGRQTPSSVIKAMGLSDARALSAVRLSLGKSNTDAMIKKAARAIIKACLEH